MDMIASQLSEDKTDIMGTDLFLYGRTPTSILGSTQRILFLFFSYL